MAVGLRKSLFGFNCGDVMKYIEKSQKSFYEKEKELSEQAAEMAERWVVDQLETLRKIAGAKFEVKQWVEEASVAACQHCRAEFSMMNRKQ